MALLVVIFIFWNSIGQQFRADGILFPPLRQALSVTGHAKDDTTNKKSNGKTDRQNANTTQN